MMVIVLEKNRATKGTQITIIQSGIPNAGPLLLVTTN